MKRCFMIIAAVILLLCETAAADVLNLPPALTHIDEEAFMGDVSLDAVTLGAQVTAIGARAFANTDLRRIELGEAVQTIGDDAFSGCDNLTIRCRKGSYAHAYAMENGIAFELIQSTPNLPILIYNNRNEIPGVYQKRYGAFDYSLEDCVSAADSTTYDPKLAYMLSSLAAAAYGDSQYICAAYEALGFERFKRYHYQSAILDFKYSGLSYTIGVKENLVLITVRGTGGDEEWVSNFTIARMANGWHMGFGTAANKVYDSLAQFLRENGFSDGALASGLTFVITGHSRGAAVGNLLAVKLREIGVPKGSVYDYNFACPDTAKLTTRFDWETGCENIYNICNSADAIAFLPGLIGNAATIGDFFSFREAVRDLFTAWGKFGRTYYFSRNWDDADAYNLLRTLPAPYAYDSTHDYALYVEDMSRRPAVGDFKSRAEVMALGLKKNLSFAADLEAIVRQLYPDYVR